MDHYTDIENKLLTVFPHICWKVDAYIPKTDNDEYTFYDIIIVGYTKNRKKYSAVIIKLTDYLRDGFTSIEKYAFEIEKAIDVYNTNT